jgi:hypothetical protein
MLCNTANLPIVKVTENHMSDWGSNCGEGLGKCVAPLQWLEIDYLQNGSSSPVG